MDRVTQIKMEDLETISLFRYKSQTTAKKAVMDGVLDALNKHIAIPVTDTKIDLSLPHNLRHFLAQAACESMGFTTLVEMADGKAYEGRKDLGNIHPGDGVKYKGRGLFQTTGYNNYLAFEQKHNLPVIDHPDILALPPHALTSGVDYWESRGLGKFAQMHDDVKFEKKFRGKVISVDPVTWISMLINGGTNGIQTRIGNYTRSKKLWN